MFVSFIVGLNCLRSHCLLLALSHTVVLGLMLIWLRNNTPPALYCQPVKTSLLSWKYIENQVPDFPIVPLKQRSMGVWSFRSLTIKRRLFEFPSHVQLTTYGELLDHSALAESVFSYRENTAFLFGWKAICMAGKLCHNVVFGIKWDLSHISLSSLAHGDSLCFALHLWNLCDCNCIVKCGCPLSGPHIKMWIIHATFCTLQSFNHLTLTYSL